MEEQRCHKNEKRLVSVFGKPFLYDSSVQLLSADLPLMLALCSFYDFLVRGNHPLIDMASGFFFQLWRREQCAHQVHFQQGAPVFLGEIILAMSLVKLMIGFHHALHQINQVSKNLHSAHTVKILRLSMAMGKSIVKCQGQAVNLMIRIRLIGGDTRQEVAAHLAASFQDHLQIRFGAVGTADQIADGGAHGDGAMPVTELPVIIAFEHGTHGMIADGKGVYYGIGCLDFFPQEAVKAIRIDTFSVSRTVKTPQTAATQGP